MGFEVVALMTGRKHGVLESVALSDGFSESALLLEYEENFMKCRYET
jgi:hypothetical protein